MLIVGWHDLDRFALVRLAAECLVFIATQSEAVVVTLAIRREQLLLVCWRAIAAEEVELADGWRQIMLALVFLIVHHDC